MLAGAHALTLGRPGAGQVPPPVVYTAFASSCIAAGVAESRVRRHGSDAAPSAALTGLGPALFTALVATRRMRSAHPQGIGLYPGIWALTGIGYIVGFYIPRMSGRLRAVLASGIGAQMLISWFASPRPRSAGSFWGELVWSAIATIGGHRLAEGLSRLSARVVNENEQGTTEHSQTQWERGWAHQQRESELLHQLARETMDAAGPSNAQHEAMLDAARREYAHLADDIGAAAAPPAPDMRRP